VAASGQTPWSLSPLSRQTVAGSRQVSFSYKQMKLLLNNKNLKAEKASILNLQLIVPKTKIMLLVQGVV
jgi:hypothetical protein